MARFRNPLDHVKVAAPCPADWDQMVGNERIRFCGQCSLNVFNLSGMTRTEAEHLIASTEGRLCVRFYRRRDGSIITKDCPVGIRAIARRVSYVAKAAMSLVIGLFAGIGAHAALSKGIDFVPGPTTGTMVREMEVFEDVAPRGRRQPPRVMGEIVRPPGRRSSPKPIVEVRSQ